MAQQLGGVSIQFSESLDCLLAGFAGGTNCGFFLNYLDVSEGMRTVIFKVNQIFITQFDSLCLDTSRR